MMTKSGTAENTDELNREAYAVVGELVMTSTALDFLLNKILIAVLKLGDDVMIESVVATLDPKRKIEILQARAKRMPKGEWKKRLEHFCKRTSDVFKQRNIACHTPPVLKEGSWTFVPVAAAKMLGALDLNTKTVKHSTIADFKEAIEIGRRTFPAGLDIIRNFEKVNSHLDR